MPELHAKDRKVVVIGIDGLPYSLIREYIDSGVMPGFGELVQQGSLFKMESSLPEVSSVAWSNFMTGKNPGEHGIFGFMELDELYKYRFPNFSDLKAPSFWEKLNLASVIINIPETYPASRPLNGLLISGFVALDLEKAVYPKDVYQTLKAMGYRLDVKAGLAAEDPDGFFDDLFEVYAKRTEAIEYFFEHENWQIFVGTITATDRLHHYFYPQALEDGPYHQQMLAFYRKLDDFIGNMFRRAKDRGALFLTCSDHGFTPIKTEVYLNRWLIDQGYLELENGKEGLSGITERSRAFCLDPARIYIHSRDKYPKGCVTASEYKAVRNNLAEQLASFRYNGENVVKRVYFGDDIFSGPYSHRGPDIYLLPHYGFDLKGAVNRPEIFAKTHFAGMHTYDDAHLFISPGRSMDSPRIEEIAHLIENYLE